MRLRRFWVRLLTCVVNRTACRSILAGASSLVDLANAMLGDAGTGTSEQRQIPHPRSIILLLEDLDLSLLSSSASFTFIYTYIYLSMAGGQSSRAYATLSLSY